VNVRLLSVGKPRDALARALHDRYAERIVRLGVRYAARCVREVPHGPRFRSDDVRRREARLLLDSLEGRGTVVALDRSGRALSSEQFAERLERWATPLVTFVVGGPLGLHREFLETADWMWSLSPLILPHELTRVVLAEQIYRAATILRGTPYHK
jgi:23S rRNA (pseudouridine1915-N3)-methyltransferase